MRFQNSLKKPVFSQSKLNQNGASFIRYFMLKKRGSNFFLIFFDDQV